MPSLPLDTLVPLLSRLIDQVLPDLATRRSAQDRLLEMRLAGELAPFHNEVTNAVTGRQRVDRWTRSARPGFLYVMYAMILFALPIGIIAAFSPATAQAIADGIIRYLSGLPEPLYTLFGTGYLGYATLRQWGKAKSTDR